MVFPRRSWTGKPASSCRRTRSSRWPRHCANWSATPPGAAHSGTRRAPASSRPSPRSALSNGCSRPIAKWLCQMAGEPRISIITAVFNGARTIYETIASVRAQSEPAWEHLIVDDGSTDATAAVVRAAADARITYHYQPHAGRSAARNRALDLARGELVLFLDADDWLVPQALRDHVAFFATHPEVDVSVSDGDICTDDGRTLATFGARRGATAADTDVAARLLVDPGLIGAPLVAMVRAEAIRRGAVRFDPEQSIAEDTLFWIALAQHARFGFHDAHTCRYRWHSG